MQWIVPVLCIRSGWSRSNSFDGHIVPERVPTSWPHSRTGLKFWAILCNKRGQCVCHATLLCLGWRAGQKANKSNHTHTHTGTHSHTKHTALQNEDNHKQMQRCWCLADGGFINVSSMNWSGVLSVGRWDKSGSSYREVQTLPIASDGHVWVMQQQTVVKTGTAETKNMVVPGYTHRVGTGILCRGPRVPLHSVDIW